MSTSNYAFCKIYRIKSPNCTGEYIGSTKNLLSRRFQGHIDSHKKWIDGRTNWCSSYAILQHGDATIELIEEYPCTTAKELHLREGFHITQSKECVNKLVAGRTYKEWYEANKTLLQQKAKVYRESHKAEKSESDRKYREANADKIKIKQQSYTEATRDAKREYDMIRRTEQRDRVNQKQRENYRKRMEAKKATTPPERPPTEKSSPRVYASSSRNPDIQQV